VPGDLFFCDRIEKNWARLSFGVLAPDQLREAAKRFGEVVKQRS
jgi:DNA-binding transcriptional MocR family regulator